MKMNKIFFLLTALMSVQATFTMNQAQAYVYTNEQGHHVLVDPQAEALFAAVDEINRKTRIEFVATQMAPHMRPEDRSILTQSITMEDIHAAARAGDIDTLRKALDENSGVVDTATEEGGYTPLHFAARHGHVAIVKLLLEHGAQIAKKSATGNTALHFSAKNFKSEMVAFLLKQGAPVDEQDNNGYTALHGAALGLDAATIKVLLEAGAKSLSLNAQGHTPYSIACGTKKGLLTLKPDLSKLPAGWSAEEAVKLLREQLDCEMEEEIKAEVNSSNNINIPGGPSIK